MIIKNGIIKSKVRQIRNALSLFFEFRNNEQNLIEPSFLKN